MASDYYANSGFLLKASEEILETLGITKKVLHDAFGNIDCGLSQGCWDTYSIMDILQQLAMHGVEFWHEIGGETAHLNFIYFDEPQSSHDEIEAEALYLEFWPEDLQTTTPTPLVGILSEKNIKVDRFSWTSWG